MQKINRLITTVYLYKLLNTSNTVAICICIPIHYRSFISFYILANNTATLILPSKLYPVLLLAVTCVYYWVSKSDGNVPALIYHHSLIESLSSSGLLALISNCLDSSLSLSLLIANTTWYFCPLSYIHSLWRTASQFLFIVRRKKLFANLIPHNRLPQRRETTWINKMRLSRGEFV